MDNATFKALSEQRQQAHVMKLASRLLGRKFATSLKTQIVDLSRNDIGHGAATELPASDDPHDPLNNFWQGHWQVYETD